MADKILMLGSNGQIGTVLSQALREKIGKENVICSDLRAPQNPQEGPFELIDVLDRDKLVQIIQEYKVTQIFHLAALLSAKGEQNPSLTWKINMQGLLNVFEISVQEKIQKVFCIHHIPAFLGLLPQ